jgi:peptide deformylase
MAIRDLVLYPDPVLLHPAKKVEIVDDSIRELVRDMTDTMYDAPGVGLAANQIGVALRVCVVDITAGEEQGQLKVFINPEVIESSGSQIGEEGCLSFPDITIEVECPYAVKVRTLDLEGNAMVVEADDFMARAMLHEFEHLEGQVFLRNLSSLKRQILKRKIKKRIQTDDWVAMSGS